MRWLVDECVDAGVVSSLRSWGHDIVDIAEIAPSINDNGVVRLARDEHRLLLTEDKDFGELIFRHAMRVPGLVLIRMAPELRSRKSGRLRTALDTYGEGLLGRYTSSSLAEFVPGCCRAATSHRAAGRISAA